MFRLLLALIVLFAAVYFIFKLTGGEKGQPLETQQQALEKAREVEQTVKDQAAELQKQIDAQTGSKKEDKDDDDKP